MKATVTTLRVGEPVFIALKPRTRRGFHELTGWRGEVLSVDAVGVRIRAWSYNLAGVAGVVDCARRDHVIPWSSVADVAILEKAARP